MSQKSDGQEKRERNQGIRIALDRMIRQAIARTISDIYKEVFGDNSYGFRPGRSCHNAIRQALVTNRIPEKKAIARTLTVTSKRVNERVRGWINCFRIGMMKQYMQEMDET